MLMLMKKRYFGFYLAGDMALYLFVKLLRGDFVYSLPLQGAKEMFVSFVMRTMMKAVTDFTGCVQLRHPGELGGLYWSFSMFGALAMSFVGVLLYYRAGGEVIEESSAWKIIGWLGGAWCCVFGIFLLLIKEEYWVTFWSSKTGNQFAVECFVSKDTDRDKSEVLMLNEKQWVTIRGQVRQWVIVNWWKWKDENPSWFNEGFVGRVPLEWIPAEDAKALLERLRKQGGLRESLRVLAAAVGGAEEEVEEVEEIRGSMRASAREGGGGGGGVRGSARGIRSSPGRSARESARPSELRMSSRVLPVN